MARVRVDKLVVEQGLVSSREKARKLVLAGEVLVDDVPVDKPGALVADSASLRLRHPLKAFVGRGGDKLAAALTELDVSVRDLRVLDVGASTGGFTDCLLQRGAASVTALDVGRAQLDWKLVSDPRVQIVDRTNARHLSRDRFPDGFDMITADVSFISLAKILPALATLVDSGGRLLVLIKPQFELTPADVGRGGIVRDPEKREHAVRSVEAIVRELGFEVKGVAPSALRGATGNQEYFLFAERP